MWLSCLEKVNPLRSWFSDLLAKERVGLNLGLTNPHYPGKTFLSPLPNVLWIRRCSSLAAGSGTTSSPCELWALLPLILSSSFPRYQQTLYVFVMIGTQLDTQGGPSTDLQTSLCSAFSSLLLGTYIYWSSWSLSCLFSVQGICRTLPQFFPLLWLWNSVKAISWGFLRAHCLPSLKDTVFFDWCTVFYKLRFSVFGLWVVSG